MTWVRPEFEFKIWSGARDLTPGPHGPELCAVSSTELGFGGFEFDLGHPPSTETRFRARKPIELLHELLHGLGRLSAVE